jgi:hypothetical protein
MVGLTYTPPLLPSLAAQAPAAEFTQIVAEILGAHAPGAVEDSLTGTLLAAAGSGNVITGTVTATAADGSVTLLTASGVQISLHHPPELPLNLGSTVTLRVVSGGTTPQAIILQVDGRPVAIRSPLTGTPAQAGSVVSQPPTSSVPAPLSSGALPGADAASAYAATLAAVIDLEEQAGGTVAPTSGALTQAQAATLSATPIADQPIIAILVRPAAAKPGQAPLPTGTRYLLVPLDGSTDDDADNLLASSVTITTRPATLSVNAPLAVATVPQAAQGVPAPPPARAPLPSLPTPQPVTSGSAPSVSSQPATDPTAAAEPALSLPPSPLPSTAPPEEPEAALPEIPPAALVDTAALPPSIIYSATATLVQTGSVTPSTAEPELPDLTEFAPQNGLLAGRVLPSTKSGVTLIETAVGTLAMSGIGPLLAGTAVRLRILGVALPDPDVLNSAGKSPARSLIDQIVELLAGEAADETSPPMGSLTLPTTSPLLMAALWNFFANSSRAERAKETLALVRQALSDVGRDDLGSRLSDVAGDIGEQHGTEAGDGWIVTILPFLGFTGEQPMRLYIKPDQGRDSPKDQKKPSGERFVLEVVFSRLGPMQFDGLVRDRRFDLALRTSSELDTGLRRGIETVFADALGACGWSGEIVFGRTARFPLMQRSTPARQGLALNV